MAERSSDWLAQGKRDLESAKSQKKEQFHEWACFISQQAAEKALKAVLQMYGAEAWGHVTIRLLEALEEETGGSSGLQSEALFLDKFYILARYPNGWGEGTPADFIKEDDAAKAIDCSEKIVRFCEGFFSGQKGAQEGDLCGGEKTNG
jgi:HEPN domain-containing protein